MLDYVYLIGRLDIHLWLLFRTCTHSEVPVTRRLTLSNMQSPTGNLRSQHQVDIASGPTANQSIT